MMNWFTHAIAWDLREKASTMLILIWRVRVE